MIRTAELSDDGVYRYALERRWQAELGLQSELAVLFVMLNPSTADESADDPTVRRCVSFASSWGYTGVQVGNLFAFRATDPGRLKVATDPIGPENDAWIVRQAQSAALIVAAWGTHGDYLDRGSAVLALLRATGRPVYCLGVTRSGQPRHPLYVVGTVLPEVLA